MRHQIYKPVVKLMQNTLFHCFTQEQSTVINIVLASTTTEASHEFNIAHMLGIPNHIPCATEDGRTLTCNQPCRICKWNNTTLLPVMHCKHNTDSLYHNYSISIFMTKNALHPKQKTTLISTSTLHHSQIVMGRSPHTCDYTIQTTRQHW